MLHNRPKYAVAIVTALLAGGIPGLAGASAPHAAPKSVPARVLANSDDLATAQRLRQELRLRADVPYLLELAERASRNDSTVHVDRGILMGDEEKTEVDDREADAADIAATARSHFAAAPADFGGVFIDHNSASTVVLVVHNLAKHEAALREKVKDPSRLEVRRASYAFTHLDALVRRIVGDFATLKASGAAVSAVTIFEQDNRVEVALAHDTPEARQVIERRYATGAIRLTGPVSNSYDGVNALNAPPLKGGQSIVTPVGSSNALCTSGYVTYRQTRTDAAIWVTDYFLATAGHCDANTRRYWRQGASTSTTGYGIGYSEQNRFVNNSSADAMRIPMSFSDRSQRVAITATNDRLIIYRQGQNADVVGETVCMSGARTGGEQCGVLTSRNYTTSSPTILYMRLATYFSQGGDSGGSVLHNSMAKGVHSGRVIYSDGRNYARYSHIFEVLLQLGLTNVYGV